MFYLVMAILTALAITVGFAIYTKDDTPETLEYFAFAIVAVCGGAFWPLALVVLSMGGLFWMVRNYVKKPDVQLPEGELE